MKSEAEVSPVAVSIVAPTGRDATLAAGTLHGAGIGSVSYPSIGELADHIDDRTHAVLLAEEALKPVDLDKLLGWLRDRPAWCDLPILVLAGGGAREDASTRILNLFGSVGNVTLLERPLRTLTLVTAVQAALRARCRQLEVRELVEQRDTILASISDAFSALDRDWRYIYANDKAAEYAGVSKEQMIGRTVWEIYPELVGGIFEESARGALETGRPVHFERFYKRWNCWLETRIYPAADGVVVLRADITERKNLEVLMRESDERLKESEDRLRLATEAASIGTFDFNPQTGELSLSDRAKAIFNLPADSSVSYAAYIGALHPDDRQVAHSAAEAVLDSTGSDHYDIVYRVVGTGDGNQRWVAERGRVLLDAERRPTRYIGTLIDITEQKHAEIALQRAKQVAEEANRAKDQFLAMLSHELRTPLTPVLMTIASLRRQTDISDDLRRDLDVLLRNVELEALLIDDLLDLTRITHGKLELHRDAVDVHASLEHALKISAGDFAEKELRITRRLEALEHHCWADAARLQQVFWNLVKNAVKFTSRGGEITLRTHNDEANNVVVEISDSGIGIAPQLLPRIFDAFEQGGRAMTSQCGGLGLVISKRVIDLHGGAIVAASAGVDHGSTFTIILKAMETSLLEGPAVYLPPENGNTTAAEIMLVEDHEDTARVLRRVLSKAGYSIAHVGTIAAARDLALRQRFDLVISDLGLPDGSGLDLMGSLRAEYGLTGIALSGFGTEDDLAASSAAGFAEHLTKPVDWPQLQNAIERLLATAREKTAAVSLSPDATTR
ncbi:hypothetical protein BH18VER1_BH18VER1_21010 [soil metagenome]